ncbi:MAG: MBL fold metallo-hydrolase [Lachnospiraceae bacterium]|nr:MBL fold metallo-hydrolase [Lachnospiraceae bacterium]
MSELKIDFRIVGPVQTNCYFIMNPERKECIVVDPGDEAENLESFMMKKDVRPVGILLTHGHFDHIGAVEELKKKYDIEVYANKEEEDTLKDPNVNLSMPMMGNAISIKADKLLSDGQVIELMGEKIKCIHTPGHTVGGMCYYLEDRDCLFSGDTLFQESVGRTDFEGGSMSEIVKSLKEKILTLPDSVKVYTGHGLMTSIEHEKMYNPFVG